MKADFAIEYTGMKKEENPHVLSQRVKSHLVDYSNHLKIYAYGSVLENEQAGAGFVIPETKTEKKFLLRKRKIYIYCTISCTIYGEMEEEEPEEILLSRSNLPSWPNVEVSVRIFYTARAKLMHVYIYILCTGRFELSATLNHPLIYQMIECNEEDVICETENKWLTHLKHMEGPVLHPIAGFSECLKKTPTRCSNMSVFVL